ncbi:MAG: hypothetical protein WC333_08210 [Dehalococcoidia bacterium]
MPANLGTVGAHFYLLGFSLIIISGICALLVNIVSLDVVWRILGGGLAVMSLGVGLISLGAAYKSSTAAKMGSNGGNTKRRKLVKTEKDEILGRLTSIEKKLDKGHINNWAKLVLTLGITVLIGGFSILSPVLAEQTDDFMNLIIPSTVLIGLGLLCILILFPVITKAVEGIRATILLLLGSLALCIICSTVIVFYQHFGVKG